MLRFALGFFCWMVLVLWIVFCLFFKNMSKVKTNPEHRQKRWLKHITTGIITRNTPVPDWGWKELLVLKGSSTHQCGLGSELKSLNMDDHILHHILTSLCKHKVSLKVKLKVHHKSLTSWQVFHPHLPTVKHVSSKSVTPSLKAKCLPPGEGHTKSLKKTTRFILGDFLQQNSQE